MLFVMLCMIFPVDRRFDIWNIRNCFAGILLYFAGIGITLLRWKSHEYLFYFVSNYFIRSWFDSFNSWGEKNYHAIAKQ